MLPEIFLGGFFQVHHFDGNGVTTAHQFFHELVVEEVGGVLFVGGQPDAFFFDEEFFGDFC